MIFRIFAFIAILLAGYAGYEAYKLYEPYFVSTPDVMEFGYGPEDADLTVVEFLDYDCSYCRNIHPVIMEAVRQDGSVRYIPRPLPSYSKDGSTAGRLYYAAGFLGKHMDMHHYLMENYGPLNQDTFRTVAEGAGLDFYAMADAYNNLRSYKALDKNSEDFSAYEKNVTPFFLIGETEFVPDSETSNVESFLELFRKEREKE